tara:strand:+ start:90 stop:872 length:783 start_codon:yes stop_codon:yes gene_type:complete
MFKKIFNYIILFGLIYLVFMHNTEKFVETAPKKKKKQKQQEENNTDVNSLIDSVIEEELFSNPISEEEAQEGMERNESNIVDKFYKMYGNNQEMEEEMQEEMQETNIEEYVEESIASEENIKPRNTEEISYAETEEEGIESSKIAFKCANNMIPKFSHKRGSKKGDEDMNIYKPKSSRIRYLQKIDESIPKTVKRVFEEKIVDFKKTNKLSKNQKERVQGCFMTGNNENSKFSTFEQESESPYDMDINANDINFENYSLI